MQHEDFEWFVANYDALYEQYGECFLAIKDKKILGVYSSIVEGVYETEKTEPLGTFIVQECNGDESAYTAYIATVFV